MKKRHVGMALILAFFTILGGCANISNNADDAQPTGRLILSDSSVFDEHHLIKVNFKCGLAPLPPLGCTVGACVCDKNGENCQWTFICN